MRSDTRTQETSPSLFGCEVRCTWYDLDKGHAQCTLHMGYDHWVAILVSIYLRDVVDLVKTVNVVNLVEDSS